MGLWEPVIAYLKPLGELAAILMVTLGCAIRALSATSSEWQGHGMKMIGAAVGGFLIFALAEPIYHLFFTWAPIGGG